MAENLFTRPVLLTLDGNATALYQKNDGRASNADDRVSGDTTDTVIKIDSRHATATIQCISSTSLTMIVYVGFNIEGTITWSTIATGSGGSGGNSAGATIAMSATANAATIVDIPCAGFTHVKLHRAAGSGTVKFCATPFAGVAGQAGANAVLAAATINEDTAATDLEIILKDGSVRRDTPATSAGTTGKWATVNQDANGAAWVSLATLIAGENLTTNRMMVEHAYSYFAPVVADTLVKSGAGFLHEFDVCQADAVPTAGTVAVLDATSAGTGTTVWSWTLTAVVFNPFCIIKDASFNTGLFIDFTTTGDVNLSGSYR